MSYVWDFPLTSIQEIASIDYQEKVSYMIAHRLFGNPGRNKMIQTNDYHQRRIDDKELDEDCKACKVGKAMRKAIQWKLEQVKYTGREAGNWHQHCQVRGEQKTEEEFLVTGNWWSHTHKMKLPPKQEEWPSRSVVGSNQRVAEK